MIGNALRIDIEVYVGQLDQNPLFVTTRAGKMTREMVTRYVAGLHHLLTLTPIHLRKARERALACGDVQLAKHFEHKLGEEVGHDAWAENDLRKLDSKRPPRGEVIATARAMGQHIESCIDENPVLYLAYIAFVEYITVMRGGEWLELLEKHCGIPRSSMSAIGNHVELDREHAEEGFAVMDDLVPDPTMLPAMRAVLQRSIACYEAYCAEATLEDVSQPHVSAA